jgi:hypothetical protein
VLADRLLLDEFRAHYFDEWRKPFCTPPAEDTRLDLAAFTDETHRCAKYTGVIVPRSFVPISVP